MSDPLSALRAAARTWADDLRSHALTLDADPGAVPETSAVPALRYLSTALIPPEYNPDPFVVGDHRGYGMTAAEQVVVAEELSCGDPAAVIAAPGASLSGVVIDLLGDEYQKAWFYGRLLARPTRTFFALTEPAHGSDVGAMQTSLTSSGLTGEKRYIGNAARAEFGVIFARECPGPLGIRAVIVETKAPGFSATPLPMIGLRGAQFTAITLDAVPVDPELVLGRQLSPARRGMWAAATMLNRLRPVVAAIALGIARAAHEYTLGQGVSGERLMAIGRRTGAVRDLIGAAARAVDVGAVDAGYLASAAKARACRLAEDVTQAAPGFLGPGGRLEHPLLDKLARDARGLEFMEGTGNIQRLNLFHGLASGKLSLPG